MIFESHSKEWFEARLKVITGTEVASLFGLNEYKSVPSIMRNKAGQPDVIQDNLAMKKGRIFEPAVIQLCRENGFDIEPAAPFGKVKFISKGKLGCSLDAVGTYNKNKMIVEIKTTSKEKYDTWTISPPLNYLLQIQVELICSDNNHGLLAVAAIPMDELESMVFGITKNDKIVKLINEEVELFWEHFNNNTQFKVCQKKKKQLIDLLNTTWKRIF